jgi:hypothetical protein
LLLQFPIVLIVAALLFWAATRFRQSWFGRRPVASLLSGFALLVLLASYLPTDRHLRTLSWDFLAVAGTYLWFVAYSLLDSGSKNRDPFALQVGTYHPFWGSTNAPFVKGAAYLRRIEAHNPEQLAIAQLKGLKLLTWAVILGFFLEKAFMPVVHGYLRIPLYSHLLELSMSCSLTAFSIQRFFVIAKATGACGCSSPLLPRLASETRFITSFVI